MTRRRRGLVAAVAAILLAAPLGTQLGQGARTARAAADTARTVTVDVPTPPDATCTCLRGTVTINATATAGAGRAITSVTFQQSVAGAATWRTIGTVNAPPYQLDWDTTPLNPVGPYDVRAIATDSSGERTVSAPARDRVVANDATFVSLADPGAVLHGNVKLTATPEDGGNIPTTVTFQRSPAGAERWTTIDTVGPELDDSGYPTGVYATTLDTAALPDGPIDLRISAKDDVSTDKFVAGPRRDRLLDNTAPTSALDDPGGPLHGLVALTGSAHDDGSGVASVRFERSAPGADTWIPIGADTSAPFTHGLDTRALEDGVYDLRVVATDRAGNAAPSAPVRDVAVANPGRARYDQLTIENVVAPARDIALLGSVAGSSQHETWAYGFTNAAPAVAAGQRLPYTAQGDRQLVLLRFTDDGGWEIADVLRNPDGSAFAQVPRSQLAAGSNFSVTGQMAPSGEAWIAISQRRTGQSAPEVGLFHRAPGGRFVLDPAATASLAPIIKSSQGIDGGELRVGQTKSGAVYGTLRAPFQTARRVLLTDADGNPTSIFERLDYGALADGRWTARRAALPPDYQPIASEFVDLAAIDPTGPATGWGLVSLSKATPRRLQLARFDDPTWTFVPTGLDAFDLTDNFSNDPPLSVVAPLALRGDGGGVWVGASVRPSPFASDVVARYDTALKQVAASWCAPGIPRPSLGCGASLTPEQAGVPDRIFETPDGKVALSLQHDVLDVFAHGSWSGVAAPGFSPGAGKALFTAPDEGWLVGANALGRLRARPTPRTLELWPEANRSPLTAVALPPGSSGAAGASGALAVGLDGTALRYDASAGWLVAPTPSRARRVALRGIAFSGPDAAFAVGQLGTILRWDGTSWIEDPQSVTLTQAQLNAVAFGRDGQGWAVGAFGTILHFDGSSWTPEQPPAGEEGVSITSVTVAGTDVFAVAGGNLITRTAGGAWRRVDRSQLPSPAPVDGDLRLVSGLPDGGVVAAGRSIVMTRANGAASFVYSSQPVEGIAVALAAYRDAGGDVRAFLSLSPPVADANGSDTHEVAGFPPGDGELLRQTADGWQDLSRAQYAGARAAGDGAVKADPVLAVASGPTGDGAWAVGGYAGTVSAARLGTDAILAARPAGWRTASIWRYDRSGSVPSPALAAADVTLPAKANTVSFAFFSSPLCKSRCAAVRDAQPDVNLKAAMAQIAAFAAQPGGPAFAMLGGNARGPIQDSDYQAGSGAFDFARLGDLLAPLGTLPLYAAYGPRDAVPTLADPSLPWADAFANAPAPFGRAPAPAAIAPAGSGPRIGPVHRYYAFDATQNGGALRVIALDNAQGSLEDSAAGQTAWLDERLADARSAGLPVVVIAARPLRGSVFGGASDGEAVAAKLVDAGVLGVFTTSGSTWTSQINRRALIPESADPSATLPQIPEYEGATLGYQQPQNNGVLWYSVAVDTAAKKLDVKAIPVVGSLAIKPLAGLSVARSSTLQFEAVGRRPTGSLATPPNDDSFPGFDSYVGIPSTSCATCIAPSYGFKSSDPTIGDFVVPSGPGSRFPKLDAAGHPTASATSGLFCGFNSGTTTISVTSGLLSSSLPVEVQAGDIGRPCGTVFRAGVGRVVLVPSSSQVSQTGSPSGARTPPPPPPAAAPVAATVLPKVTLPPPPPPAPVPGKPHPPAAARPTPTPPAAVPPLAAPPVPSQLNAVPPTPVVAVPPIPPVATPIPPGGAASAQAAARRKEKAVKHASQSAFTTRPAGTTGGDWFYPTMGVVSVLAMLLIAGAVRPGPKTRPALLLARDLGPTRRRRMGRT